MPLRKGGPGLVGRAAKTAARTALITATATTVANKMTRPARAGTPIDPAGGTPPSGGISE